MNLMELSAKLTLDDADYQKGISGAEKSGEQFSNKMSALTVAAGQAIYNIAMKAVSAIAGMFKTAIGNYSDYQQLIGGVETLFKSSASKVEQYANQAYKTAGMSANKYMETVTSFSASLLQGLKGDTEQAAELANMAVIDMADNANKMGTDLSAIQTAYAGFAKQNYTMLDNLKLGYGGTKEEMIRLVNDSGILETKIESLDGITFDQLLLAIHEIQKQMHITGTTAAEAEGTLAGSISQMKAAWDNLLAVVAGEGDGNKLRLAEEAFGASVETFLSGIIPTMLTTITNGDILVSALVNSITDLPENTLEQVTGALLSSGERMLGAIDKLANWLINNLTSTLESLAVDDSKIEAFGNALGMLIGHVAGNFITKFPLIVKSMIQVGVDLAGSIIQGIWKGLFGSESSNEIEKINQEIENKIAGVEIASSRAQAILQYMQSLYDKYGEAARQTQQWKEAEDQLESVMSGSKDVFDKYGSNIEGAITRLQAMSAELRKLAIQNALQDKLNEQYAGLGEAYAQKYTAEANIGEAQNQQQILEMERSETMKAYAAELLSLYTQMYEKNKMSTEGVEMFKEWQAYANGQYYSNGELYDYSSLSKEKQAQLEAEVVRDLKDFYEGAGTAEEDTIWGKNPNDYIVSPEVFEQISDNYELLNTKITDNEEALKNASQAIIDWESEIKTTETAIERAAYDLTGMDGATTETAQALSNLKFTIWDFGVELGNIISSAGGGTAVVEDVSWLPKAIGMDYVPYDGFKAELHRGEAIITRDENRRRGQVGYADMEYALEQAIERSMSRMYVNMSGEKVADITTRRTEKNISATERARSRSMGG